MGIYGVTNYAVRNAHRRSDPHGAGSANERRAETRAGNVMLFAFIGGGDRTSRCLRRLPRDVEPVFEVALLTRYFRRSLSDLDHGGFAGLFHTRTPRDQSRSAGALRYE